MDRKPTAPELEAVASMLKQHREDVGLSILEASTAVGCSAAEIEDAEEARELPSEDLVYRAAEAYGLSVNRLRILNNARQYAAQVFVNDIIRQQLLSKGYSDRPNYTNEQLGEILSGVLATPSNVSEETPGASKVTGRHGVDQLYMQHDDMTSLVFLCHSSGDKEQVRSLYRRLVADGVHCWFDEEDLLPGQDWEYEISRAIKKSKYVLACLSSASITQTGYVQKELRKALDVADEQPEDVAYLIPIRLEECDIPERLRRWQWVDLFKDDGYDRLLRGLGSRRLFGKPASKYRSKNASSAIGQHAEPSAESNTQVAESAGAISFNERVMVVIEAAWLESFGEQATITQVASRPDGGIDGLIWSQTFPDERVSFKTFPSPVSQLHAESVQQTLNSIDGACLILSETRLPSKWLMRIHSRIVLLEVFGAMFWHEDGGTSESLARSFIAMRSAGYAYEVYLRTLALAESALGDSLLTVGVAHHTTGKNPSFVLAPTLRREAKFGLTFVLGQEEHPELQAIDSLTWLRKNNLPGVLVTRRDRVEQWVRNNLLTNEMRPLVELSLWRDAQDDEAMKRCLRKVTDAAQ